MRLPFLKRKDSTGGIIAPQTLTVHADTEADEHVLETCFMELLRAYNHNNRQDALEALRAFILHTQLEEEQENATYQR